MSNSQKKTEDAQDNLDHSKKIATKSGVKRFQIIRGNTAPEVLKENVSKVQTHLHRFGYLKENYDLGNIDKPTQEAILRFQSYHGLNQTGLIDDDTSECMEMPRCGTPDPIDPNSTSSVAANFVLKGCSYQSIHRTLTYAFINGTQDILGESEKIAVKNAFTTWQQQIPIDFVEVATTNNPIFKIGWFVGNHSDGAPFDGAGNTLAHAFYPPPCGGTFSGAMHFDDAELWGLAHSAGKFDVETVALHEIGHLLGLAHSTVAGSVMFPSYGGQKRGLTTDDIAGIVSLYGKRGPKLSILVHLQDIGDVSFRDNEFAGTRGQSRRLEGFQITINPSISGLSLRYMAHLQNIGDVLLVNEGIFVGTRGQSRRLEGFAIELTGPTAPKFNVKYMAHLQDLGDTRFFSNGEFCGTRGQSRRVEGILIKIEPK